MTREALCFDMYGTLCDTGSVAGTLGDELDISDEFAGRLDELWREKQLQYSYQLGQMDAYRPFREATEEALRYALAAYDLDPDEETVDRLLSSYDELDPYPDARDALAELHDAGYAVTVLSNGNPEMLEALAANAGLDAHLDEIISAHEVETFKPAPAVYENAADRLGREIGECWLVSSNAWDAAGAAAAGMNVAWVNRANEVFERIGGEPDLVVESLGEVADELA